MTTGSPSTVVCISGTMKSSSYELKHGLKTCTRKLLSAGNSVNDGLALLSLGIWIVLVTVTSKVPLDAKS